jgi:transposase
MDRDQFWLDEGQFARLAPHLPTDTRGKPRVDDRRVISGIVPVLKSGGRWVDAPAIYGPKKDAVQSLRALGGQRDLGGYFFHALASAGGPPAEVLIDATAVKAHSCASGGKGGNSPRRSAARAAAGRRNSTP